MAHSARITFYDLSNLLYSSFYLAGFAANTGPYRFDVTRRAPVLEGLPGTTSLAHILLFRAELGGDDFHFCIDTRDSAWAGADRGSGYDLAILEKVKLYFKVNYDANAIRTDPVLASFSEKIVPVLPFFPIAARYLPRVIPNRRMGWTPRETLRRLKHLRDIPALEEIVRMRGLEPELDIFFVVNFSGKKEHAADDEYRYLVALQIQNDRDIRSVVGFVGQGEMPAKFSELRLQRHGLRDYLSRVARSRLAIYVRGLHDCISFKFGQLLAMGMPIVGQAIVNNTDRFADLDHFDEQFGFDDPALIVSRAADLLGDPEKLSRFSRANAATFDTILTPAAVVSEVVRRIGVPVES